MYTFWKDTNIPPAVGSWAWRKGGPDAAGGGEVGWWAAGRRRPLTQNWKVLVGQVRMWQLMT